MAIWRMKDIFHCLCALKTGLIPISGCSASGRYLLRFCSQFPLQLIRIADTGSIPARGDLSFLHIACSDYAAAIVSCTPKWIDIDGGEIDLDPASLWQKKV